MNGRHISIQKVFDGIEAAKKAGLAIKINMVVQKGVNDQDVLPMAAYFRKEGHVLRFIEFMDVGNTNKWNLEHVMTKNEIIELINSTYPIKPEPPQYTGEVANRFFYKDGSVKGLLIILPWESVTGQIQSSKWVIFWVLNR